MKNKIEALFRRGAKESQIERVLERQGEDKVFVKRLCRETNPKLGD